MSYDIECKRLGQSLYKGRNLIKEYVNNGILRFTVSSHRYGQFAPSGLMIGYIQDIGPQDALNEINNNHTALLPEILLSSEGWKDDVSRLDHQLNRLEVEPSAFDLRHLWVDLRQHYQQNTSGSKKRVPIKSKKLGKKTRPLE